MRWVLRENECGVTFAQTRRHGHMPEKSIPAALSFPRPRFPYDMRHSRSISMEAEMKGRNFAAMVAFGMMLAASVAFSQSKPSIEGPAVGETPAWFLQGSFPDPTGRTIVEPGGKVTVPARAGGAGGRGAGGRGVAARGAASAAVAVPGCSRSPVCGRRGGTPRQSCSASNGNRRSATRSNIHGYFARVRRGPAVCLD